MTTPSSFDDLSNLPLATQLHSKQGNVYLTSTKPPKIEIGSSDVEITSANFADYFGGRKRKTKRRTPRRKRTVKRLRRKL